MFTKKFKAIRQDFLAYTTVVMFSFIFWKFLNFKEFKKDKSF